MDGNLRFLARDGEMRQRIREFDWHQTGLGAPETWPCSLKMALSIMLDSATACYIAWGPHYYQFYNDAYIAILGQDKHRDAIGRTTPETWQEIWDFIDPLFLQVRQSGQAISIANQLLPMLRNGYLEECYFTFSYSPLLDEHGEIGGIFATAWETTVEFVRNRRQNGLRLLAQGLAQAEDVAAARTAFESTVYSCGEDLPFGMWYSRRPDDSALDLVAAAGIETGSTLAPTVIDLHGVGIYAGLMQRAQREHVDYMLGEGLVRPCLTRAMRVPQRLRMEPLRYSDHAEVDGYIVLGVNPMRPYDEEQKAFLEGIVQHIEKSLRRINRSLRERQEVDYHLQTVMSALPCAVWIADTEQKCIFVNQAWLDLTGRSFEEELGDGWLSRVHPDDLPVIARHRTSLSQYRANPDGQYSATFEIRLLTADNEYRWLLTRVSLRYDTCGNYLGSIRTCLDITERKRHEQVLVASRKELRTLYDRLQTVREEERRALAREVHDQLGQILSAAKIDIRLLAADVSGRSRLVRSKILDELDSAHRAIEKAIETVRRLAHELRPPELESQGLAAAIRWHLEDFGSRTKIGCSLDMPAQAPEVDTAVAFALFGIFQEALTNVLRHAQATQVWVVLRHEAGELTLQVRDNGIGVGAVEVESARTLGITGMVERAAAVGGRLEIVPAPPSGTMVRITVPCEGREGRTLGAGGGHERTDVPEDRPRRKW